MDKHKNVRNHIAAAKGWLNQAEDSLEQANDIRGDLNLMLAQAELQRAQEKKVQGGWLRWAKRLLPLAVALCVAVGYVIYLRPTAQAPAQPVEAYGAGEAAAKDKAEKIPENSRSSLPVQAGTAPEGSGGELDRLNEGNEMNTAAAGVPAAASPHYQAEAAAPEPAAGQEGEAERRHYQAQPDMPAVELPDTEMQRLMQDAGSVLRE